MARAGLDLRTSLRGGSCRHTPTLPAVKASELRHSPAAPQVNQHRTRSGAVAPSARKCGVLARRPPNGPGDRAPMPPPGGTLRRAVADHGRRAQMHRCNTPNSWWPRQALVRLHASVVGGSRGGPPARCTSPGNPNAGAPGIVAGARPPGDLHRVCASLRSVYARPSASGGGAMPTARADEFTAWRRPSRPPRSL